jgi:hypothetical protein
MTLLNPDKWAQFHMRWLALSRWDNEGGASPTRPTERQTDTDGASRQGKPEQPVEVPKGQTDSRSRVSGQ